MDVNLMREIVTVASLLLFVLLVLHTWSRRRQGEHEAAARLPFLDSAPAEIPTERGAAAASQPESKE